MQPNEVRQYLQGFTAQADKLRAEAERLQEQLAAVQERVESRDGAVTLTVGAGGIMRGITFGPAASSMRAATLSTTVMAAYQEGCRLAAERSAALVAEHAPQSPAVQMMRDAIPPDPDPDGTAVGEVSR